MKNFHPVSLTPIVRPTPALPPKALVPAPNPTVLTYPLLHVYQYQPQTDARTVAVGINVLFESDVGTYSRLRGARISVIVVVSDFGPDGCERQILLVGQHLPIAD
jgi:hypothetical protein